MLQAHFKLSIFGVVSVCIAMLIVGWSVTLVRTENGIRCWPDIRGPQRMYPTYCGQLNIDQRGGGMAFEFLSYFLSQPLSTIQICLPTLKSTNLCEVHQ